MGLQPSLNSSEIFEVVSIFDDSIVKDSSDVEKYKETYEMSHLTLKDDPESPSVWFTIRALSKAELGQVMRETANDLERTLEEVFRRTCMGIRNFRWQNKEGKIQHLVFKKESQAGGPKRVTDEVSLIIPHEVRLEMGMLSFTKSALGDGPRKNS